MLRHKGSASSRQGDFLNMLVFYQNLLPQVEGHRVCRQETAILNKQHFVVTLLSVAVAVEKKKWGFSVDNYQ